MSYQVLARKWRPRRFSELIGQEHVVRALENALTSGRLHHAYLFTGTRGVGKTTVARVFAKALNCEGGVTAEPCGQCSACTEVDEGRFVDLIEVDAASRARVDETRELMDNVQYAPARGRYKVYLIDEVHMFSAHSFNALLKTLEEPPPHVKFLLATTDPQKMPVTVLSRCLQFHLRQLPAAEIVGHLTVLTEAEAVQAEPAGLALIGRAAAGSMRDALSLLDQAIAHGDGAVLEADVRAMLGVTRQDAVHDIVERLADGDAAQLLSLMDTLASEAVDFADLLAELLGVLQRLAVAKLVPEREQDALDAARVQALSERFSAEDIQLLYQIGILGRRDLPYALDARNGVEMTLLRMLAFRPDDGAEGGEPSAHSPPAKTTDNAPTGRRASGNSASGDRTAGDSAPGQTASGRTAPVSPASDSSAPGATASSQTASDHSAPGATASGQMAPDHSTTGATTSGHTAPDHSAPDNSTPGNIDPGYRVSGTATRASVAPATTSHEVASSHSAGAPAERQQRPAPPQALSEAASSPQSQVSPAMNGASAVAAEQPHASAGMHGGDSALAPSDAFAAQASDAATLANTHTSAKVELTPQTWREVVEQLGLRGLSKELAYNTQFVAEHDNVLEIRIAPPHAQLRVARAEQTLAEALREYTNRQLHLRIEVAETDYETPRQALTREANTAHAQATAAIREDPTVQAICDMFDATVDPDEIQPRPGRDT